MWLLSPQDLATTRVEDKPTLKMLPSPSSSAAARFGMCMLMISETEVLLAGGSTGVLTPHFDDYVYNL